VPFSLPKNTDCKLNLKELWQCPRHCTSDGLRTPPKMFSSVLKLKIYGIACARPVASASPLPYPVIRQFSQQCNDTCRYAVYAMQYAQRRYSCLLASSCVSSVTTSQTASTSAPSPARVARSVYPLTLDPPMNENENKNENCCDVKCRRVVDLDANLVHSLLLDLLYQLAVLKKAFIYQ